MNKLIFAILLVGGLTLANAPEAVAHSEVRNVHVVPAGHRVFVHRTEHMPHWLKHDRSFRHWYRHTPLKWRRHLGWHELYDLFLWERAGAGHRRSHGPHRDYRHHDGHDYRDRDRRRRRH